MKRAHSSGKSGPAFDPVEKDVDDDLAALRRQEYGHWRALSERKYPRFPVKAVGPRTTTKGDSDGR